MLPLDPADFPAAHGFTKAIWAPVLLRPILGSPEMLVIGVLVTDGATTHLAPANSLDRLQCLFGENAGWVTFAAQAGLAALQEDIQERAHNAMLDFSPTLSGITIGEVREGEGVSLEAIAQSWLASLSSLHQPESLERQALTVQPPSEIELFDKTDRLPNLVLAYVTQRRPGLIDFFSEEIRNHARSRRRSNPSDLIIDYAGSKLVANFGILSATNYPVSVDRLKRRLWDLIVSRDREPAYLSKRAHEILVQSPPADDPQFTERQLSRVADGLNLLKSQAEQEKIRFLALNNVPAIGDHLIAAEA